MNKKGISPLIATVILIGFTIAIAVMVWYWYSGFVKEQVQKQGAASEIKAACANEIGVSIDSACATTSLLSLTVKNEKNAVVQGILVRLTGTKGTEVLRENDAIDPLGSKQYQLSFSSAGSAPYTVELFPVIVRQGVGGTCEQSVKYNIATASSSC